MTSHYLRRRIAIIPVLLVAWLVQTSAHAQTCVSPPAGLVAWWSGDGNASDRQGANNGTLMGGATFAPGKVSQGFSLNKATSAYIRVPNSPSLELVNGTIEAWIRPDWVSGANGYNPCVVAMRNTLATRYSLHIRDDYSAIDLFTDGTPSVAIFVLGTPLVQGQLYHIGLVESNGNMSCYVNGIQVGGTQVKSFNTNANLPVNIGSADGTKEFFTGIIDELSIYNRALSASEIQAIYNAGIAGKCTFAGQTCVPKPSGIVTWLAGDGNANDIQGANNGTLTNGATFTTGKVGQAFSFDGVDDYVVVPDSEAQRPANITIEGWFKVLQIPTNGQDFILVSKYGGNWNGWHLLLRGDLKTEFALRRQPEQPGVDVGSSVSIQLGQWTHLACTYDGTNGKIYVNGALQGTASFPGGYTPTLTPMTIGRASHYDGGFAQEQVDEFSVYNRALTETEINSIFTTGSAGNCKDTDGDRLSDYDESVVYGTNPLSADTDGDGMPDGWEIQFGLNPNVNDAGYDHDLDWLTNLQEYNLWLVNGFQSPSSTDSDGDGRTDYFQVNGQRGSRNFFDRTDRLLGVEYESGLSLGYQYDGNGNLLRQVYLGRDSNTNGLPDLWEFQNGLTNNTGSFVDTDGDGWSDFQEWQSGTNPNDRQSTPNLLGNPGINIASMQLPFTPSNFICGVGQLDGSGAEEIVVGGDGNPGTNMNFLLVLTQGATNWSPQRVDVGQFGITSIAVGQPTNRPSVGIYVGLRGTNGIGRLMEFTMTNGTWQSNLVAFSTNEAAFVAGIRQSGDLLANLATNGMSGALWSLTFSNLGWNLSLISSNASHRGIPNHGSVFSRSSRDSAMRLLDAGSIEVVGGDTELYKDNILLPSGLLFNPATSKYHLVTPTAMTWVSASNYFSQLHGKIALPMSAEENDWFNSKFYQASWIGLYLIGGTPYFSDGSPAPTSHYPFYVGYANWDRPPDTHGRERSYVRWKFESAAPYWGLSADYELIGIGEFVPPVLVLTNRWLIQEPPAANRIVWRGLQLQAGQPRPQVTNQSSIFHCFVDDPNVSGSVDGADMFVFAEYQISNNFVVASTLTNIPVGSGILAQSFVLSAVDFLNYGADHIFTAEPNGGIYSWSATDAPSPLKRQVFTEDYFGKAWHALAGVKMAAGGEGLVGLMVDPTNQSMCKVMFWPPQAVLSSPQLGVFQTAPLTRILPTPNSGKGLAKVKIRIWDAEGNASLPMLQYRPPGTSNWVDASLLKLNGTNYNFSMRVVALPTGSEHEFLWNATTNLGIGFTNTVLLRARSLDVTLLGEWSEPVPYQIEIPNDSDGDGMPDWWELANNLDPLSGIGTNGLSGDPDLDGFSNWSEFIADTNPRDASSYLRISDLRLFEDAIAVDWFAGPQSRQILQRKSGLNLSPWLPVWTNEAGTSDRSFTNALGTNAALFFRIQAERH